MTIEEKIKKARKLMLEVIQERRDKARAKSDNMLCKCGHKHKNHSDTYSVNYTAGFCSLCDCEHFLMKQ